MADKNKENNLKEFDILDNMTNIYISIIIQQSQFKRINNRSWSAPERLSDCGFV